MNDTCLLKFVYVILPDFVKIDDIDWFDWLFVKFDIKFLAS